MVDATYSPKVYRKQGGDELVVASGGKINIETGGTIEVNGDDLIAEIAALTGLDSGELGVLNAVTAGTVAASKAVVVDANKDVADFRNLSGTNLKAGKDAVAGTMTVFPTTTAKGKAVFDCTDQTGNTQVTHRTAAMGQATVITTPDPGASAASVVLTEGAQTVNGVKTFGSPIIKKLVTGITAFATGGQASAVALTGEYNDVTTVAANFDSVKLLPAAAGQDQVVRNNGANILAVFPTSGDAIDALAADLSIDLPVGAEVRFFAIDGTTWRSDARALTSHSPSTQKGNLTLIAADSAGNTDTRITNASQAAARIYSVPDAGADASFVMSEGTQTINGAKTFGSSPDAPQAGYKVDGVATSPLKWVDVTATAALLDAAGTVNVIAGVAGDQYKLRDIRLVGGGTNFGAGGDRLINLTDGTTVWTQIANADIEAAPAATLAWGNAKVPFLTGTSDTASVAGQAIRFVYSGGTTDHGGTGSIKFSVLLEKVA